MPVLFSRARRVSKQRLMCGSGRDQPLTTTSLVDAVRMVQRQGQAGVAAGRVAHHVGALQAQGVHHLDDVVAHVGHRMRIGQGAHAAARAAMVVQHHRKRLSSASICGAQKAPEPPRPADRITVARRRRGHGPRSTGRRRFRCASTASLADMGDRGDLDHEAGLHQAALDAVAGRLVAGEVLGIDLVDRSGSWTSRSGRCGSWSRRPSCRRRSRSPT
jgi:hypothetical protein